MNNPGIVRAYIRRALIHRKRSPFPSGEGYGEVACGARRRGFGCQILKIYLKSPLFYVIIYTELAVFDSLLAAFRGIICEKAGEENEGKTKKGKD